MSLYEGPKCDLHTVHTVFRKIAVPPLETVLVDISAEQLGQDVDVPVITSFNEEPGQDRWDFIAILANLGPGRQDIACLWFLDR